MSEPTQGTSNMGNMYSTTTHGTQSTQGTQDEFRNDLLLRNNNYTPAAVYPASHLSAGASSPIHPQSTPQQTIQKNTQPHASFTSSPPILSPTPTSPSSSNSIHHLLSPNTSSPIEDQERLSPNKTPPQTGNEELTLAEQQGVEFTSNILKNLNSGGKRQLPDAIPTELDSKKVKRNDLLLNDENEGHARRILSKLLQEPWAAPFEIPVDPVRLNLPDYYSIIKRPMDLGTVSNNLKEKKYPNISFFADDVRLVFNNAMEYNEPGSEIFKAARSLLTQFDVAMKSTNWNQAYDTKIPEVTTPIIAISKGSLNAATGKPSPVVKADVTHIDGDGEATPASPPPVKTEKSGRAGSHARYGGSKNGMYNCLVYYQNETIPYDFEWPQIHSREDFEQKLRSSLNIGSMVELEIGIKRQKPNFGREVFVQLSPRWEEFPRVSCILVKHKKQ